MIKNKLTEIITVILILAISSFSFISLVQARSSAEIQAEIDAQNATLNKTKQDLEKAQQDLNAKVTDLNGAQGELATILAEIEKLTAEKKYNETLLEIVISEQKLKELEKEERLARQSLSLRNSYMDWRTNNPIANSIAKTQYDFNKTEQYNATVLKDDNIDINLIIDDLRDLDGQISDYQEQLKKLEQINADLENKKKELEARVAYLNSLAASTYGQVSTLQNQSQNIQKQINNLLDEQKSAYEREKWILEQENGNGGTINEGTQLNFFGVGRDLYQGHGVGMSQWGAYGMALSHGFTAQNIINFYYTNVAIATGYENASVTVDGYGVINVENYVAGQGEVPGRACGTQEQRDARPDKYVVDNTSTPWDCWPEEAIKAQVIAFRTYGISRGWLYSDARSQVYNGGQYTRWAADETRGQVITYAGQVIDALYSSDNNQGNGTADNDTIWQNFSGYGTPVGYLRAVNDNAYAAYTQWTNWHYNTGNYNFTHIDEMLNYAANPSGPYAPNVSNEAGSLKSAIGNVTGVGFERDASQRVKRVWLTGSTGQTRSIGGWWFKNIWNSWSYDTGRLDYIYSQTFYISVH